MNFLEWMGFKKVMEDTEIKKEYVDPTSKEETKKEKQAVTYYRLGLTDNNRVSLQMGYSEITMNADGINNLIKQLELFRDQLMEEKHEPTDA